MNYVKTQESEEIFNYNKLWFVNIVKSRVDIKHLNTIVALEKQF